jgi:hypothetical protein
MTRRLIAAASVILACAAGGLCQEAGESDFFQARREVFRAYRATPVPELTRLYQETADRYAKAKSPGFLYRAAAFAELAGLYGQQEQLLLEILSTGAPGGRLVKFCIEVLRARGDLRANMAPVMAAIERLSGDERTSALIAAAGACEWTKPPDELLTAVLAQDAAGLKTRDAVELAQALASWGMRDKAADMLAGRASAAGTDDEAALALSNNLRMFGAVDAARRLAADSYARAHPVEEPQSEPLGDFYISRERALAPAVSLAQTANAWDLLINKIAARGKQSAGALIDYAVILDAAGAYGEKAEVLKRLSDSRRDAGSAALYGGALIQAGDAYSTQEALTGSLLEGPGLDENPYLDLFDAVIVLRDPQTVLRAAAAYANLFPEPQAARMMSEYVRVLGDFRTSDKLFASFILSSGLGPDTRFNWEGSRFLAEYYLNTGRLEDGKATARRALAQLLDVQGKKEMSASAQPEKFVALFDRFGGVDELLQYCLSRQDEMPNGTLLALLELEAYEHSGKLDEALAIVKQLYGRDNPALYASFVADTYARTGHVEESIKFYQEAVAGGRQIPKSVHQRLLEQYKKTGRWDEAQELLSSILDAQGPGAWLYIAGFLEEAGQAARAGRVLSGFDDPSVNAGAAEISTAVRFFAGAADYERSSRILLQAILPEESFGAKYDLLSETLPESAAACGNYLQLGERLEKGPLGTDHRLIGAFYRMLSIRAAKLDDYDTAFAAAKAACAHEPQRIENALQLAAIADAVHPDDQEGAAETAYAALPSSEKLLVLIEAELALSRTGAADGHIGELLLMPLPAAEAFELSRLLAAYPVKSELVAKAIGAATSAWPWTLRANLADAALAGGDRESALAQARTVVAGGSYVGRAFWAAGFYAKSGMPSDAGAALALFAASSEGHPAVALAEVDLAAGQGNAAGAAGLAASAARRYSRPQFAALFRMEAARSSAAKANSSGGAGK